MTYDQNYPIIESGGPHGQTLIVLGDKENLTSATGSLSEAKYILGLVAGNQGQLDQHKGGELDAGF